MPRKLRDPNVTSRAGWGAAARALTRCSGRVPVLLAATGPVVSGPALLLGLADHVVIGASHTGLVYSAEAARLATCFLQHGRFAPPAISAGG